MALELGTRVCLEAPGSVAARVLDVRASLGGRTDALPRPGGQRA